MLFYHSRNRAAHHRLTVTVMKTYFKKKSPIIISYRNYKKFDIADFRKDLFDNLLICSTEIIDYDVFHDIFMTVLNIHAPLKSKTLRGNNACSMNKTLSKAFMIRSKLKNNFNKDPSEYNNALFKKQRNFCVKLLKMEKKSYYDNLNLKIFRNNKSFWKNIKPLFSDKSKILDRDIILIDENVVISDKLAVAEMFNKSFIDSVKKLPIERFLPVPYHFISFKNINKIISDYKSHPSILKIRDLVKTGIKFDFDLTTPEDFEQVILMLDCNKGAVPNDIPVKILNCSSNIVSSYLSTIYNVAKNDCYFPETLKCANVIPIHKKGDKTSSKNYRPISLLPTISKLFERIMYDQILFYIERFLSSSLFGFRKGHSAENCLTVMIETWKNNYIIKCSQVVF